MNEFDELFEKGGIQLLNPTPAEPLANRKAPYYENKQERPAHRVALELAAKGFDVKEIAEMTGYTPVSVNNWLRQPHSQQTLVNEIRRIHGADEEVVEIIKDNVVCAVQTLTEIMKDNKARNADRIAAAERLLERRYGKANQPINRGTDVDLNALSDSELARMLPTESTATS